ncbi:MAG TPA: DUF222 domain-containing protein [Actinomycetota bacterium]|nr:DUF222 domain-containing protein [Actinomycetota bacterium]
MDETTVSGDAGSADETGSAVDAGEAIAQVQALVNCATACQLDMIAAHDHSQAWRSDGVGSMAEWLALRLGVSARTARELTRVAHALPDLPAIAEAFRAGQLSFEQVRQLTLFATPATDSGLCARALGMSEAEVAALARAAKRVTVEESNDSYEKRSLKMRWDLDGRVFRFWGRLPDAEGAVVEKAIERLADAAPSGPAADDASADEPPNQSSTRPLYEARCADALVQLASQDLSGASDADRACVVVHVDATASTRGDTVHHPTCEERVSADGEGATVGDPAMNGDKPSGSLPVGMEPSGSLLDSPAGIQGGPAIATETLERLACDCRLQFVCYSQDGSAIGIGRVNRKIPPWLHRQVRKRDIGCRFPACGRNRWVDSHHIVPWSRSGPTDLDNLVLLCGQHHRLMHEGGWRLEGGPDSKLTFRRPDGTPLAIGPLKMSTQTIRRSEQWLGSARPLSPQPHGGE